MKCIHPKLLYPEYFKYTVILKLVTGHACCTKVIFIYFSVEWVTRNREAVKKNKKMQPIMKPQCVLRYNAAKKGVYYSQFMNKPIVNFMFYLWIGLKSCFKIRSLAVNHLHGKIIEL